MSPTVLLIAFFVFTVAAIGAAGYVFVLRPSRIEASAAEIPAPIALDQREMPIAQAAVVDLFRLIGEAMPGAQAAATLHFRDSVFGKEEYAPKIDS